MFNGFGWCGGCICNNLDVSKLGNTSVIIAGGVEGREDLIEIDGFNILIATVLGTRPLLGVS